MGERKEDRISGIEEQRGNKEGRNGRKVIFQRFKKDAGRHPYPYPPVYREPDTDYICFTTDQETHSDYWKMQTVESLEQESLEPYLVDYAAWFELAQNQVQMGPVFAGKPEENLLTVPIQEELPLVKLDLEKFEPTADENGKFIHQKNPVYQKGKYGGRLLLLTIGVPVSNQIDTIDRCLSHIKPLLDGLDSELVVIDTGSTDGTIEVCKSYGARVYEHPWHDNMSAVRNEAIRHARGLWYMSIDDDEWFEDVKEILWFFKSGEYRKYTSATYIQRNYSDSQGRVFHDFHTTRMAVVTPDLHFEGRIHDALLVKEKGGKQLHAYAHHYGFVGDRPDKGQAKFQRNATILLGDVYEYPEDIRYLFQLANEYKGTSEVKTAMGLFAECIAMSIQQEKTYRGREAAGGLTDCLYRLDDERLFPWGDNLQQVFPMITAEKCHFAFLMADQAYTKRKPAEETLSYFDRYEELMEEYRKDNNPKKRITYFALPTVEHDHYVHNALAIGFYACLRLEEEERALGLLSRFSLETAKDKRTAVLLEAFAASDEVFQAVCQKLTPMQWEEWSDKVLDALGASMTRYAVKEQQKARLPEILSRLSVSAVQNWLGSSEIGGKEKVRKKLTEYALEADEAGRLVDGATPLSELALCAGVLKEAYVKTRPSEQTGQGAEEKSGLNLEPEEQEKSRRLLKAYVLSQGVFAERYYRPELLEDGGDTSLPPDVRAVYRMASALADGAASGENVALLKQALKIFPPFHQEVRSILEGLRR